VDDEATDRERDLSDPDAFGAFAARRLDSAYRTAALILRDRSAAEDAVHEAFLRAWRRRNDLRDPAAAGAWFGRILLNACRDQLRHGSRAPRPLTASVRDISARLPGSGGAPVAPVAPVAPFAPDPLAEIAQRDEIGGALRRLTRDEQIVLALRFGEDRTVPEIAAVLGLPEGTVKSRLHGALAHTRAALDAERRADPSRRTPR